MRKRGKGDEGKRKKEQVEKETNVGKYEEEEGRKRNMEGLEA